MQEVQAAVRRNGAFHCRLDECLEEPGIFRLEYVVSTWAEHLRQNMRMTVDERRILDAAWGLILGTRSPSCAIILQLNGASIFTDTASAGARSGRPPTGQHPAWPLRRPPRVRDARLENGSLQLRAASR